ncbi:Wadjet anti-phage system protein JetD domain-containing protein [Viscerimonas tarda]
MITVSEIKKKANTLYKEYLQSIVEANQSFFPRQIRSNKKPSDDFVKMKEELNELISCSTDRKSYGYSIHYETINTKKHGLQSLPQSITFECEENYLKFIGREKEVALFKRNVSQITSEFPQLHHWCQNNPAAITANSEKWYDILKVCRYFTSNPNPDLYIRQLPIEIHTKFIEENKVIIQSLLNILIHNHIQNQNERVFEKRFGLKYKPVQIRIRILDHDIANQYLHGLTDISITEEELISLDFHCSKVYITENEMNFLTLPAIEHAIAIFGKGFAINALKNVSWLQSKSIFYWGDIDIHGFQILSQLRGYFPNTKSIMMNMNTYEEFKEMSVENKVANPPMLSNLDENEICMYEFLKENGRRLEQEKITYLYSVKFLG